MAVLVEAFSVIVRRDSIEKYFTGGWPGFLEAVPNCTCCYEEDLVRVGFMDHIAVLQFIETLEQGGLIYLKDGEAVDIIVCDQNDGPATECEWIEFGRLFYEDGGHVSAARFYDSRRSADIAREEPAKVKLKVPANWQFEGSVSQRSQSFSKVDDPSDLAFLREENGMEVYWHKILNKEVYITRGEGTEPLAPGMLFN